MYVDPYAASLVVAMYYPYPLVKPTYVLPVLPKDDKERSPKKVHEPSGLGANVDTYA